MSADGALLQYVAKLERRCALPSVDREMLLGLSGFRRSYQANETIIAEGVASTHCIIVQSGFVSRIKSFHDGARQIVAFHIPGDAVDLQSVLFTETDHTIFAHTPTETCWIAHEDILRLTDLRPVLARTLWLDTLVDASIFREWTANVGQRMARERIAHLFLEMAARFEAIDMLNASTFELPIGQTGMAQALGISLVHMNKSLQSLRKEGFLNVRGRSVTIDNREQMTTFCGFDPTYLHLGPARIKELLKVF